MDNKGEKQARKSVKKKSTLDKAITSPKSENSQSGQGGKKLKASIAKIKLR